MTEDSPKPLTDEEVAAIRSILTADSRRRWAISALGATAKWVAALAAGWLAVKGFLAEAMTWR
jgi:hypothetical protein